MHWELEAWSQRRDVAIFVEGLHRDHYISRHGCGQCVHSPFFSFSVLVAALDLTQVCCAAMAVSIVEVTSRNAPTIQYGNMYVRARVPVFHLNSRWCACRCRIKDHLYRAAQGVPSS